MITNLIGRIFGSTQRRTTEALLERMGLDDATHLGAIVDPFDRLGSELSRARRYEHAFSVAVLSTSPLPAVFGNGNGDSHAAKSGNGNGRAAATIETQVPQVVSLLAAAALRELLRESDVVCYQASEDRFVLGLVESDGDASRYALRRIRAVLRTRLNLEARVGVARFPDDGLTLEDLIATARGRATGSGVEDVEEPSARANGTAHRPPTPREPIPETSGNS